MVTWAFSNCIWFDTETNVHIPDVKIERIRRLPFVWKCSNKYHSQ